MTNQEKIQFLRRYRQILHRIALLQKDLIAWREVGEKITPSLTGMPQGGENAPRVEQAAVMIADTEKEINARIYQLSGIYRKIEDAISGMEDVTLQNILHRRYIQGQKWEEIAVDMHYSYMHVCRLHGQALEKIML